MYYSFLTMSLLISDDHWSVGPTLAHMRVQVLVVNADISNLLTGCRKRFLVPTSRIISVVNTDLRDPVRFVL